MDSKVIETYDNVVNTEEGKDKNETGPQVQEELKEVSNEGYSNEGFDDFNWGGIKTCEIKNEARILDMDLETYIPAGNIPDKLSDKDEENKTFRLVEESSLFSQLCENKLKPQNLNFYSEDNPCKMVEVKAGEIPRSVVTAVESLVVPGPDDVEMVQIGDDTDTEPESSSPAINRRLLKQQEETVTSSDENVSKHPLVRKVEECAKFKRSGSDVDKDIRYPPKVPKTIEETENFDMNRHCADATQEDTVKQESYPKPLNFENTKVQIEFVGENNNTKRMLDSTINNLREIFSNKEIQRKEKKKVKQKSKADAPDTDIDSFYGSDKENDEELVFSEDETNSGDIFDSDSSSSESEEYYNESPNGKVSLR